MKFRIPLLLILLMRLIMPWSYAQTPPELPKEQNNAYGIELGESYPGIVILEILTAAENEIDAAVKEAYEEGYKAGVLEYAPKLAAAEALREMTQLSVEAERKKTKYFWQGLFITGGIAFLGGATIGGLSGR
jgi:hypothetical protein